MKKHLLFIISVCSLVMLWSGCEDWVTSTDPLGGQVQDDQLTTESAIPFVLNGVWGALSEATNYCTACSDLLADQMIQDYDVPGSGNSQYEEIDKGDIRLDTNTLHRVYSAVSELRFYADDVLRRAGEINFQDSDLRDETLFVGNFMGAIARYDYATYIGLTENQGGSPIDEGPFIPSAELYDLAIGKFQEALAYADAYRIRVINSMIARIHLFEGDYANARTFALNGLVNGDDPFQASYNAADIENLYWEDMGVINAECAIDPRFNDYVQANPDESVRIPLQSVEGMSGENTFYLQTKYDRETPISLMSWQENELMLAELDIRDGNPASALTRINAIRASHGLADLAAVDLGVLIEERDKELFLTGARLPDQRRMDMWHLAEDTWRYLPIPHTERNANPNID